MSEILEESLWNEAPTDKNINPHAEFYLLGSILLDARTLPIIEEYVKAEDFGVFKARTVFAACQYLRDIGEEITEVTLAQKFTDDGTLKKLGGIVFVYRLVDFCASTATAGTNAKVVRLLAARRNSVRISEMNTDELLSNNITNEEAATRLLEASSGLTKKAPNIRDQARDLLKDIQAHHDAKSKLLGLSTGYDELDALTGGFMAGEVTVLAARPAMGKSAFAVNVAMLAALENKRVMVFSLEMSPRALLRRMVSANTRIEERRLATGSIAPTEWDRLGRSIGKLAETQLTLCEIYDLSAAKLFATVRAAEQTKHVDLVIIDYLQLMQGTRSDNKNREREVAEISRSLKNMAAELKVPVMALSQLNRGVETRGEKRPGLADLRESGAIEQDADVVMFIYRDEIYNEHSEDKGKAEIIVSKNRSGAQATATLAFAPTIQRFDSLSRRQS